MLHFIVIHYHLSQQQRRRIQVLVRVSRLISYYNQGEVYII